MMIASHDENNAMPPDRFTRVRFPYWPTNTVWVTDHSFSPLLLFFIRRYSLTSLQLLIRLHENGRRLQNFNAYESRGSPAYENVVRTK